jgi:hypothetical protein
MSTTPFPIEYTDTEQVTKEINLRQDPSDPTKYFVWQIPTSVDVINNFVRQANEKATVNFGDMRNSPDRFALGRQYATKKASLLILDEMSVNWIISGFPVTVGNISINRLQAIVEASKPVRARLEAELWDIYIKLSNFEVTNNYQSPSPYVDTGGQINFS